MPFRWIITALVFLVTVINYIDRVAISYAIVPLGKEFSLNDADFGWLFSGWGFGYFLMCLGGGGRLCDRLGTKKVWSVAIILWSIVTILMSMATGFWSLLLLRIALGIAEGLHFPALCRTLANWVSERERGRSLAMGLVGVPVACVIGAPLCSWLILQFSWRVMFVVLGCFGIAWSFLWMWLSANHPRESRWMKQKELQKIEASPLLPKPEKKKTGKISWREILFNPSLMANNWAFFVFGFVLFFGSNWLPGYFSQTYHEPLSRMGLFLILPWLLAAIALLCGGYLTDFLTIRTRCLRKSRSHLIWICQGLSMLSFLPVIFFQNVTAAIFFISLGMAFGMMPNAIFYSLNIDIAKERTGFTTGIMVTALALSGIISPLLTGVLTEHFGNFSAAILLLVLLNLSSIVGILLFQYPDRDRLN